MFNRAHLFGVKGCSHLFKNTNSRQGTAGLRRRDGVSRTAAAGIIIIVVLVLVAGVYLAARHSASPSASSSTAPTTSAVVTTATSAAASSSGTTPTSTAPTGPVVTPPNSSTLVDDSPAYAPDSLDPAQAFVSTDGTVLTNVFQELVEYNGSNYLQVVPVIASSYSISGDSKTYTFTIRSGVRFSNGDPVNASTVWFSYVRELYDGQSVGIANYAELTANLTTASQTGLDLPWGLREAIQNVTGLPTTTDVNLTISVLNNMLSNFNAANATQQRIMEYPHQAYVVDSAETFSVNLLEPYKYFLLDVAVWWGAVVDPVFVDAHGGVQANTPNNYFSSNGGPGTGPYMIKSIGSAFTYVVLEANPNYWAKGVDGIPRVAQPAQISTVIVNFGVSHSNRIEAFDTNQAQISYVSIPYLGQLYDSYQFRSTVPFDAVFRNFGFQPISTAFQMNTQRFPTNITDFRLAVVHAVNMSQILSALFTYNNTVLGQLYLGPISPQYPGLYNPGDLPLYAYNVSLAEHYLNISGWQGDFHVVTPSGQVLGNPTAPLLPKLVIYTIAPESPFENSENLIIQQGLAQIGVATSIQAVTSAVYSGWTTPSNTPNFFTPVYWIPDWPDPVFQQLIPLVTTIDSVGAWMNVSSVNAVASELPFVTNASQLTRLITQIYNTTYWYAPFMWLPNSASYLFVQPYLQGLQFNEFVYYWYNTMYYGATANT
jgi:peptide/nickel transport system substrate-binding protein